MADATAPPINAVIVDDHEVVRVGLAALLDSQPDIHVQGVAATGEPGLELIKEVRPDVALVDCSLPTMAGIELCRVVARVLPGTVVIALSADSHDEVALRAVEAGARGYVSKDIAADELVRAVRAVAQGGAMLDPQVPGLVLSAKVPTPQSRPALSPREVDVLRRAARGATNKDIARELGITQNAAKDILGQVLKKLDSRTRSQAAVTAIRRGLI